MFYCDDCDSDRPQFCRHDCDHYDGAPDYRPGMGPGDPVRCDND